MSETRRPLLGITMGDPGGIGPEVCVKALSEAEIYNTCRPLLIGDVRVVANAIEFCGMDLEARPCSSPNKGVFTRGIVDVLDLGNMPIDELRHKEVTARQGDASFAYVAEAIRLAMDGALDGSVTGPINKESINAAGHHYAGHTEIYADMTGTKDYAMMLVDGAFRVSHVSTHVSLREACDRVKKARVEAVVKLTNAALRKTGISTPRIGVAGLNPHCGEAGLFGTEDVEEVNPAVAACHAAGICIEGPIPADTVFAKMRGGLYDAVVAMYHDQGHIPTKLVGFHYDSATDTWGQMAGVNVTLGLPIVRTSVDHGTAFDRAGEGRANPQSMIDAIRLGAKLA